MIELCLMLSLASADRFVASAPAPILVVVFARAGMSSSDVLEAASAALGTAEMKVVSPEQVGASSAEFEACPLEARSSCWVKAALRSPEVRGLLLVSIQPDPSGHRLTLVSFDLRAVAPLLARDDGEAVEQAVWERAVRSPPEVLQREDLPAFFARRKQAELGSLLLELSPSARGSVRLNGVERGAEIRLDGAILGVTTSTSAEIALVPAGTHRFGWSREGLGVEREVVVHAGAQAIDLTLMGDPFPWKPIAYSIAGATAAAGAAMLIAELARGSSPVLCVHDAAPSDCEGDVPELEPGPGGVAIADLDRGPRSLLVAGSGLLAAGAAWLIGTAIAEDEVLWIVFAAGLALGAGAAGLAYSQ
jgi:hypothetical protein